MLDKIQTIETSWKVLDIAVLPVALRTPVTQYTLEIGANMELDSHHGRWLMLVDFDDTGDDTTPDDIVEQLANGTIGFHKYPYDGISWDILGVEPASYAGYLRATRYLRDTLPAELVKTETLYFLV